ncbi:GSCOCG00001498001-RA-CDS [Cotesia congregata]|nr:GSCOCG00001498001-RA-CDS [Cotesia congregata]
MAGGEILVCLDLETCEEKAFHALIATREKADSCPSADEDEAADGGLPKRLHENTAHAASHAAHHHDALVTLAQDSKPGSSAPRLN